MPLKPKGQKTISSFFAPKPAPSSQITERIRQPLDAVHANSADATNDRNLSPARLDADRLSCEAKTFGHDSLKRNAATDKAPATKRPKLSTFAAHGDDGDEDHNDDLRSSARPHDKPYSLRAAGPRTARFLYRRDSLRSDDISSFPQESIPIDETEQIGLTQSQKEDLHRRFVKKLGHPDSIAQLKKRHGLDAANGTNEDDAQADGLANASEDDEEPGGASRQTGSLKATKSKISSRKGVTALTPMERQVIDIKKQNTDTLLVVEVGYKYRFFGEDARVAAKELGIVCIPGKLRFDQHSSEAHLDRFASASIPTHRLHVHVKRLVQAGHKVGVVRQLETAALKAAGDNRNAPFVRKLTNLYTKGTYIDESEAIDDTHVTERSTQRSPGYLLCITETPTKGWGTDEKVEIGIVAVQPSTGDILYDVFEDGFMRGELETRLLHISPCELVVVGALSSATEKLIAHLTQTSLNIFGEKARIERIGRSKLSAASAFEHISDFYQSNINASLPADIARYDALLNMAKNFSEHTTVCVSAMIRHLSAYNLEHVFNIDSNFHPFSARSHMLLNANTLTSLEIYRNQTDHVEKGSLLWILDQTQTPFGKRLLRKWVGRPLLDLTTLQERVDAVEELRLPERMVSSERIRALLSKSRIDLERGLIRVYYGRCTRPELLALLQAFQTIANEFLGMKSSSEAGFASDLLNNCVFALPAISNKVVGFLAQMNLQSASNNDKYSFFQENCQDDTTVALKLRFSDVEAAFDDQKRSIASVLKKPRVEFVSVAGIDYLVEVDNSAIRAVPASWIKISGTKKTSRFHTPDVIKLIKERDQSKEALAVACDTAYVAFLAEISAEYSQLRNAVQALATLDCLLSLAEVASRPGYVKPRFCRETCIKVRGGRHPMVEQLLLKPYVPNDIDLTAKQRGVLLTGPNMGGKSSFVRSLALISIMAQIGSYVPAESAELGMLDAVYTRMGAQDNMMKGESTFMVELRETSDILKQASPRSLVILDELGRGTSTFDGIAIAHSVLEYILRDKGCLLLFITHYQSLASVASGLTIAGHDHPTTESALRNMHMRFTETSGESGVSQDITFLYELGEGVAHRSYGLNVARLAKVPGEVIASAQERSCALESELKISKLSRLLRNASGISAADLDEFVRALSEL